VKFIVVSFAFCFLFCKAKSMDSCDCRANFQFLKAGVENNYVGYEYRTRKLGKSLLDSINFKLDKSVDTVQGTYSCYLLLHKYLAYFKDPHLTISFKSTNDIKKRISDIFYNFPKAGTDLLSKRYSKENGTLEGEYESVFYNQRIRVVKFKNNYVGYIIRADNLFWHPKQIKFIISNKDFANNYLLFYGKDHVITRKKFSFDGQKIELVPGDIFIKGLAVDEVKKYSNPTFYPLSDKTSVLKLNDFDYSNKAKADSIVHLYWDELNEKPNLIIDIRNNAGGASLCFDTLIGLLYTNSYISDRYSKLYSRENIGLELKALTKTLSEQELLSYKDSMNSYLGKFVDISPDTVIRESVFPNPKKIVILIDGGVMSAAEIFVDYARKSKKVTLMGMNTRGAYDNVDVIQRDMPCALFRYGCPITRVERKELVDGIGFAPDIRLNFKKYSEWIIIARKYLEKNEK
jgi:Peptidase family S41